MGTHVVHLCLHDHIGKLVAAISRTLSSHAIIFAETIAIHVGNSFFTTGD